jgi:hypothetical protein
MRKNIPLAALMLTACIAGAAPLQLRWTADTADPQPWRGVIFRGERAGLNATLTQYGGALSLSADAEATFYWQTNGMDSAWWPAEATATTSGVLSATWIPAMDTGAELYTFYIGVVDATATTYRAYGQIRMHDAPGAVPNEIDLPARSIDFAQVEITNEPWATPDDLDAATNGLLSSEGDPIAGPIAQAALEAANSITLSGLGGLTNTAPTIYGRIRLEGTLPKITIIDTDSTQGNAMELQMGRLFWGPGASYNATFPSASGQFALEDYADSAVASHATDAAAHADLFAGLASEDWVEIINWRAEDIATNLIYTVVVSNGHWLIIEEDAE